MKCLGTWYKLYLKSSKISGSQVDKVDVIIEGEQDMETDGGGWGGEEEMEHGRKEEEEEGAAGRRGGGKQDG